MLNTRWDHAAIFRRHRRVPAAQAIADGIRRHIVSGDLGVGHRLPSVRRLATAHAVSVPTMQSALHILRAIGFVRTVHGVGTFVAQPRELGASLLHAWQMAEPWELSLARQAIDREAPIIVALHVHRHAVRPLPASIRDLLVFADERDRARHHWPEQMVEADADLHRAILAAVPGMPSSTALFDVIHLRLRRELVAHADRLRRDAGLAAQHRAMVHAIVDGRPVSAGRLARRIARDELGPIRR